MTTLLCDPRVRRVPLHDDGQPLVALDDGFGTGTPTSRLVRRDLAERLGQARAALPSGYGLRVVEGFRRPESQQAIIDAYGAELRRTRPDADEAELLRLISRYVAPLDVAPHVAGAAVDLTLTDDRGAELWLGCALDATPEQSDGACFADSPDLDPEARAHRRLLARVLGSAGLVNYPTEWWHWSYGDRYWALLTGAPAALFGAVRSDVAA